MRNLKTRPLAFFLAALFVASFIVVGLAMGINWGDFAALLFTAYKSVPIALVLWGLFVKWGWKWKIFSGWLVPFPCLDGTWHGTIQTTWQDPRTGKSPGPIPVILTIKQSFHRISLVMRTKEMTSRSYLADFWLDGDEQVSTLGYVYTSEPSLKVADRSQPHHGTMVFEILGNTANELKGKYWTTRKTTGEVNLTLRTRERLDKYPEDLGGHPVQEVDKE
ncbi:MAG: hypothetical protein RLY93_06145 [Sumerlaeia bacterium]